jgi:hypothetical protein
MPSFIQAIIPARVTDVNSVAKEIKKTPFKKLTFLFFSSKTDIYPSL